MSNSFENILQSAITNKLQKDIDLKTDDGWGGVKGQSSYKNKPIEIWNTKDMLQYFLQTFSEKVGFDHNIGIASGQQQILILGDKIHKHTGTRLSKIETKKYIDWFIENKAKKMIGKYQVFKMRWLYSDFSLSEYFDSKEVPQVESFTQKDISATFSKCKYFSDFILKWGIVSGAIVLQKKHKLSDEQIITRMSSEIKEMVKGQKFEQIIISTENLNPYPKNCDIPLIGNVFERITLETNEFFDLDILEFDVSKKKIGIDPEDLNFE